MAAASAGLSVVIISLSKVLLVVTALIVLLRGKRTTQETTSWQCMWTPRMVLVIIFAFALSLLWTSAPLNQALGAMGKYGKFLVIPALLLLIRTHREATWALVAFLGAQTFLLVSSWLLYFHVPLVWATSNMALNSYAVFSSYLDQGIMSAVVAAIFWHLKALAPNRPLFYAAAVLSFLALGNVFVVFVGRTGHLVGVVIISMAIFWSLPRRYRIATVLAPPALLFLAIFSFDNVAQRFSHTKTEISAYSVGVGAATSADNRLDFWKGSAEAIHQKPLAGTGAGSWATEYNRIQSLKYPDHKNISVGGNPHQEFLLWGIQLGVGGIFLLAAFIGAVNLDLLKMDRAVARAGQSVLAALTVSCLFNSSLYDAYIGDFFCLSLGVLLAYGIRSREAPSPVEQKTIDV
ncbi:MAG: O-antigen ligase family protein [Candidatus Saccharibacteria bacterium]|nr:O-antigen ligase family protein [Rhodoferax sp.]